MHMCSGERCQVGGSAGRHKDPIVSQFRLAAVGGVIRANGKWPGDYFCKKPIARLTGFIETITWDTTKPEGRPRRCPDTSSAEREFGFNAVPTVEVGLRNITEWYSEECSRP